MKDNHSLPPELEVCKMATIVLLIAFGVVVITVIVATLDHIGLF